MTPERWRRVTEIVHAATARTPAARAAFLDATCPDPSLRADVDALLAAQKGAAEEEGTRQPGPHFEPGVSLGPYQIDALVGAGGMGEVYRATDRRLQRTVAIKVLLPALSAGPGFDLRFEREAQLLASLNHPNIGAIYGLEDLDGIRALVLEYVEGPTLAERIEAGRLPVHESLALARQVAFALEAAHEKAIVHRDLKPSNIKITPDGVVKVLDFGIAKSADRGAPSDAVTSPPTRTGQILGTAGYMSPEQARGRRVDKRTDIWAFGCVLFEMLTGRSPFDADTTSDVIARILERDPPWQLLPADVPESIHKVLRRCLQKDANERLHDIADARLEIAEALTLTRKRAAAGRLSAMPARWLWAAVATVAVIAISVVAFRWGGMMSSGSTVDLGVMFPDNVVPAHGVAVSPDGRRVAAGTTGRLRQIWMHSLETGETRAVPGTERGAYPFWSNDGSRIAFFQAGVLRSLKLADGTVSEICKVGNSAIGGTWTGDGRIIIARDGQLFVVAAAGGEPKLLTRTKVPGLVSFPQLLPDGRHVLFHARDLGGGWVAAANVETGQVRRLVASDAAPVFAPPDRLLFARGASLVAQAFNPTTLALGGEPQVVANGVGPGVLSGDAGTIGASQAGVLAFIAERGGRAGQLTWFDRGGRAEGSIKASDEGEYLNPAISPTGDRVAVNRMDRQTGNWDIWIVDAARGAPSKLTSDSAVDSDAIWSADGTEVVFSSTRDGQQGLYRQSIDGAGSAVPIYFSKSGATLIAHDWTRDGKFIVFTESGSSIGVLPLASDRKPTALLTGFAPRVSPDGQWIAYASPEAGTLEVYVQRFPTLGSKQRISESGGTHPRWISEGRELAYWAIPAGLNVVNIIRGAAVGETRAIIRAPIPALIDNRTHFDVARDGRRFLARQPAGPPGPGVRVILNWTGRLK
jgi:Tol biopolymer transport system component